MPARSEAGEGMREVLQKASVCFSALQGGCNIEANVVLLGGSGL